MTAGTKALVTGGAGFIGSKLAERLLNDGVDVRVLDNFATGSRENLAAIGGDVDIVEGDIQSYERTNVTGTLNVLLAARDAGVRRVVFAYKEGVAGSNPAPGSSLGYRQPATFPVWAPPQSASPLARG